MRPFTKLVAFDPSPGDPVFFSGGYTTDTHTCFSDNGPGLPPGREDTLFEKFTRGEEESAVNGVGLGLAIVRAIVEAHKGTVKAENRPEGGARFIITLPAGEPPVVPKEA